MRHRLRPGKVVCVGRNYAEHARELGNAVPEKPLLFLKPPSAIIADGEAIVLPVESQRVEHEGELGIVLRRSLRRASEEEAREAVGGITCCNDVTARDLQKSDGQWTRAKGFDTFCPVGPRIIRVESDFDMARLEVTCRVNGAVRQHGRVADMTFPVPVLLSYISRIMTLEVGDLVLTGTPSGVGPLVAGDVVEVEVTGVGVLSNPVEDMTDGVL